MKIGIIMGGLSSEREVSLKTGEAMYKTVCELGYDAKKIIINCKEDILDIDEIDFGLIALHGKFGEDGTVQSYLNLKGIPFSGCSALTSGICMDKNMTKNVLKANDIPTANWVTVKNVDDIDVVDCLSYPVFVKPNSGGSSVATFKVNSVDKLKSAVEEALKWDTEVMIEEFIPGEEITCAMLDGKMLPVFKIDAKGEFFDLKSKYEDGGADEYVFSMDEKMEKKIKSICQKTWDALNLEVYSRVDIIVGEKGMNVLEINTLPGFTSASLFPKSAKASGLEMKDLVQKIVDLSLMKK